MTDDGWTEIAYIEHPVGDTKILLEPHLDAWLADHGLARSTIDDDDVRLDVLNLGPGNGCALRLIIKTSVLGRSPGA